MTRQERKEIKEAFALTDSPKEARDLYKLIKPKTYQQRKQETRAKAQALQVYEFAQSWGEIAQQCQHLEKLAKRYGLLKEFRSEGII